MSQTVEGEEDLWRSSQDSGAIAETQEGPSLQTQSDKFPQDHTHTELRTMFPTVKGNGVIATNSHPMKGRSGCVRSGLNYQCFGDKEGITLCHGPDLGHLGEREVGSEHLGS